jgi:hypothetical protein
MASGPKPTSAAQQLANPAHPEPCRHTVSVLPLTGGAHAREGKRLLPLAHACHRAGRLQVDTVFRDRQ